MYLATASIFGVAIALNQHPDWREAAQSAGDSFARVADAHVIKPVARIGRTEFARLFSTPATHASGAIAPQQPAPVAIARQSAPRDPIAAEIARQIEIEQMLAKKQAQAEAAPRDLPDTPPQPEVAPLDLHPSVAENAPAAPSPAPPAQASGPTIGVAQLAPPRPAMTLAPQEAPQNQQAALSPPPRFTPSSGEVTRVVERLKENLSAEMFENFALFLYVSKASAGPLAQHMYVFDKGGDGDLALKYDWPVSTGRERVEYNKGERLPSFTPQGYYELDPDRIYKHYTSSQWDQEMPYAMFFNYVKGGYKTGLAIHAATGEDIPLLGRRASAGCIRLSPENARILFSLIRDHYKGLAPRFAYDRRTGTMSNDGILLHDAGGHVQMAQGYKVLIFIENYGGNDNIVAALF
jgi:lipoprotein-anchoring transpeptidase ErfK/SrfK